MTADTKRSWMNMIRVGSTVTTEAWDEYYKPNLTWNHAWGAAPANIIPRRLFGIEPLEPAFRLIQIKPQPAELTNARLKLPTIRGSVECVWERQNDKYNLRITIPANTRARIWLPSDSSEFIQEGGKKINEIENIRSLGQNEDYFLYEVDSGTYQFSGRIAGR
jgi:hypothetical protein